MSIRYYIFILFIFFASKTSCFAAEYRFIGPWIVETNRFENGFDLKLDKFDSKLMINKGWGIQPFALEILFNKKIILNFTYSFNQADLTNNFKSKTAEQVDHYFSQIDKSSSNIFYQKFFIGGGYSLLKFDNISLMGIKNKQIFIESFTKFGPTFLKINDVKILAKKRGSHDKSILSIDGFRVKPGFSWQVGINCLIINPQKNHNGFNFFAYWGHYENEFNLPIYVERYLSEKQVFNRNQKVSVNTWGVGLGMEFFRFNYFKKAGQN